MKENTQRVALIPTSLQRVNQQLPTLKQSIVLEEARAPRFSRLTIMGGIILILAAMGWAAITPIEQSAVGSGEILITDKIKGVQHTNGGTLSEIYVREGDFVKEGQMLFRLDAKDLKLELDIISLKESTLQIQIDRLRALGLNQNFDVTQYPNALSKVVDDQKSMYDMQLRNREDQRLTIGSQLGQRRTQLALTLGQEHDVRHQLEDLEQQRDMTKKLHEKKLGTNADYRRAEEVVVKMRKELAISIDQSQSIRQKISEDEARLIEFDTSLRDQSLTQMGDATAELAHLNEQKIRLQDRLNGLTIKAPISGIAKGVNDLKVGTVIDAGKSIFQIVPLANVEAEIHISPKDIVAVQPGQTVKLTAPAVTTEPAHTLDGKVSQISSVIFTDKHQQPFYKVFVTLTKSYFGSNPHKNQLTPGMTVTADIQTGQRTLAELFIRPLTQKSKLNG